MKAQTFRLYVFQHECPRYIWSVRIRSAFHQSWQSSLPLHVSSSVSPPWQESVDSSHLSSIWCNYAPLDTSEVPHSHLWCDERPHSVSLSLSWLKLHLRYMMIPVRVKRKPCFLPFPLRSHRFFPQSQRDGFNWRLYFLCHLVSGANTWPTLPCNAIRSHSFIHASYRMNLLFLGQATMKVQWNAQSKI